jgi:hypothetical protein
MRAMILTEQKRVEESPLTEREMGVPRAVIFRVKFEIA